MGSVALMMLLTAASGVFCIDLIQPDSKVVQPGQSLTITCQVSGYSLTDSYGTGISVTTSYGTGWMTVEEKIWCWAKLWERPPPGCNHKTPKVGAQ
ncbi:hypothetical protein ILYODFUR_002085 [Ilyodon furcidens]|uniref:Ig-like domain-containing protein n=2 Tax=Goodeidae TaxID=28758 RepID=A0ABV0TRI7_9TELE